MPDAASSITRNTTTPIPSLKSDSPVILISRLFGAFDIFNMLKTAIGSVGDIMAPKRRQYINERLTSKMNKSSHVRTPTIKTEIRVLAVARLVILYFRSARS